MAVALFRHPHLIRGVIHTAFGAVLLERGIAELPEQVGESLGWVRVPDEDEPVRRLSGSRPSDTAHDSGTDTSTSDIAAPRRE